MSTPVIVFGPTGSVGSIAAQTAQQHGARVWLAMRDTSKTIPGLSAEEEKSGSYERVQADLSKPDTVSAAVVKSGAKHAFIYVVHGSNMKETFEAMKASGVTLVVLLSSFTVKEPLDDNPPEEVIPHVHAIVEKALEEVYGTGNYVTLRPGGFATNTLRWAKGIASGTLPLYGTKFEQDGITPDDMGRVGGTILAKGAQDGQYAVYLYGPQLLTQQEMAQTVAKVLGKELKVVPQTAEQAREMFTAAGVPGPVVNYMIKRLGDDEAEALPRPKFEEGVANVQKYTGRPAMGFEEWVEKNKGLFV